MGISVKVSRKELTAYLLVIIAAVAVLVITVIFAGAFKAKVSSIARKVAGTVSLTVGNGFAVIDAVRFSDEEIAAQISESKAAAEKVLKENNLPIIRDFTAEEEAEIMNGRLSPEDAVKILSGKNPETGFSIDLNFETDNFTVENDSKSAAENADKAIGEKITRLYGLKAYYLGLLGNMLNQAKQEYGTLSKSQGSSAIKTIAQKYISKAAALETECDSKVYEVLDELECELEKIGADTSVISSIEQAYIKEKRLKKSYYLTNYKY